ncbi:MAG TPA: hypothetical protein VGY55_09310 [Pirellulales bacterium]|jgi:hypothetical protein|nr:hypothetical protein [Pirellulales bacterium]
MTLAAASVQAHTFGGGGGGGGSGAGFARNASSGGFGSNSAGQIQQAQPIYRPAPVVSNLTKPVVSNVPKNDSPVFNSTKTFSRLDNANSAGLTRKIDSSKFIDSSKVVGDSKPLGLGNKLDSAKLLDSRKNLNLGKNLDASKDFSKPVINGGLASKNLISKGTKSINGKLADAVKAGKLDSLASGAAARKLGMADQLKLVSKGDIARRLNLSDKLQKNGGWQKRMCGPIDSHYCDHCKGQFYCGPKWCPCHCWCPRWCGWVDWCFGCPVWFDPRPDFCEPVQCDDCEVDATVVVDRDGNPDSWVDDDRPQEPAEVDVDLELVAIRFVDNGNAEKNIGPRYRALIRNNGKQSVDHPFNVAAIVGAATEQSDETPRAGKRVPGIDAGQTLAIDIRLPADANATIKDDDGHTVAKFPKLGVMVDTRNEIEEQTKENNGMALERDKILMVDPAIFAADAKQATMGQTVNLAGEGLGPEAGQVLVRVGSLELQAEIEGWYDLGVQIKLPSLPLAGEAKAELVVVRGDGAMANPIALKLAATQSAPPPAADGE